MNHFKEDLEKESLCEMCPENKQHFATKIALCLKDEIVIVQQLCSRCAVMIGSAIRTGRSGYENITLKNKVL